MYIVNINFIDYIRVTPSVFPLVAPIRKNAGLCIGLLCRGRWQLFILLPSSGPCGPWTEKG